MPKSSKKQKLYCYVDETGQDTLGKFFIVSVVVAADAREEMVARLEQIERVSRKANAKWIAARPAERIAYMTAVLSDPLFKGTLHFSYYEQTTQYMAMTVVTTARAIFSIPGQGVAAVYVDGLPRPRVQWFGTELRHLGIRTSKVVGVRREESDALIRLADACCGFIRNALLGKDPKLGVLFERAKKNGYLRDI